MNAPGTAHPTRLRGVNLGGWLVLEKWMTPSLFAGLAGHRRDHLVCGAGRGVPDAAARALGQLHHARRFRLARWRRHQRRAHSDRSLDFWPALSVSRKYGANPHPFVEAASTCSTAHSTGRRNSVFVSSSTCMRRRAARTASTTAASRMSANGTRARNSSRIRSTFWGGLPALLLASRLYGDSGAQ